MTAGLLIITHNRIGDDLLQTASNLFDPIPLSTRTLAVSLNCNPDDLQKKAEQLYEELDTGDGVLILTDVFGSTPSNIASSLLTHDNAHMVSGLCLPMLIRIYNYASLDLEALAEKAVSGGHDGIIHCTSPEGCHD
jgi:PTS system ascorbate-specific IIA component